MAIMADHELSFVTRLALLDRLSSRFFYLAYTDQQDGVHAGEYEFLEEFLAETVLEEDGEVVSEEQFLDSAPVTAFGEYDFDGRSGVSRSTVGSAPVLLTGGVPSTETPETLSFAPDEVREFSHAGFDGGISGGVEATANPMVYPCTISALEAAKVRAQESSQEGLEGVSINLCGEDILVFPTGGKAGGGSSKGGLVYPYRFIARGVEFLVRASSSGSISGSIQLVRFRYLAESVQGHRDRFYEVHFGFVLPFLKKLGLVVHSDKLSRVDMQCLIDVPVSEFVFLLDSGHVVTKLRKKVVYGTMTRVQTIELGSVSNSQLCIYNKGDELRAKKSNIVKEAQFIRDCVGDEWYNSKRPITRVEIRLGRDALKSLGVSSVRDLQERERGIIDLLTSDWFRILAEPKVRGHETCIVGSERVSAAIHPIWERVRSLFFQSFTGAAVTDVTWNRSKSLVCDQEGAFALERQALGCLSKALACRYGAQAEPSLSVELACGWVERVGNELHGKLNLCAELVRLKTGIELGVSSYDSVGYSDALEPRVVDLSRERIREYLHSLEGAR
jgi:hypothetical protein